MSRARESGSLAAGSRVGDFTVERPIAEGGMGEVYLARAEDGGEVALKLVRAQLARDESYRRRFDREVRAAARVEHPRLVSVLAVGEHDGRPFLAQELMVGGSLEGRIEAEGPLAPARVHEICAQAAAGLEALHAASIVHRDVKPGNILFDADDGARISDLGLAKASDFSVLSVAGQVVGTTTYMAPEQIRGEEAAPATDVYALGCVAYECLTGAPPFAGRPGMQSMWAHLKEPPPDPAAANPACPPAVGSAILAALAKDPGERPASPGEFARSLALEG